MPEHELEDSAVVGSREGLFGHDDAVQQVLVTREGRNRRQQPAVT